MTEIEPAGGNQPDEVHEPVVGPVGVPTEAKLFLGLGAFLVLLAAVYAYTTGRSSEGIEYAGVLVLVGGGAFALFFATFLALTLRRIQEDVERMEENTAEGRHGDELYLPVESIWPIGIGFGIAIMGAGVTLGFWVLLPGVALFAHSLIGFARQSRTRSMT